MHILKVSAAIAVVVAGMALGPATMASASEAEAAASDANNCTAHIETDDQHWWERTKYRVAMNCESLEPGTEARGVAVFAIIDEYTPWTQVTGTWHYSDWYLSGTFAAPTAKVEYRSAG
jgi:hypothetical protein